MKGGPFGIFFEKKSHNAEKKLKGDPLVSPGIVCYAEKEVKPFWFSSLGQIIQFETIEFCRTFKNYFGKFVWIEKSHYYSRFSLHEAPTNNNSLITYHNTTANNSRLDKFWVFMSYPASTISLRVCFLTSGFLFCRMSMAGVVLSTPQAILLGAPTSLRGGDVKMRPLAAPPPSIPPNKEPPSTVPGLPRGRGGETSNLGRNRLLLLPLAPDPFSISLYSLL